MINVKVTQSCLTLCNPMGCSMPAFSILHYPQSLLKLMFIESMMLSNHLILYCLLLLLPSIFPSIRVISNESALYIRWPKYLSFSFSISPSNEYSGLIYFKTDWCDLLAVQGTLKNLLQHQFKGIISSVGRQALLSLGLPRQEYWSGLPFPSPGNLPHPGIKCVSCIGRWILYH